MSSVRSTMRVSGPELGSRDEPFCRRRSSAAMSSSLRVSSNVLSERRPAASMAYTLTFARLAALTTESSLACMAGDAGRPSEKYTMVLRPGQIVSDWMIVMSALAVPNPRWSRSMLSKLRIIRISMLASCASTIDWASVELLPALGPKAAAASMPTAPESASSCLIRLLIWARRSASESSREVPAAVTRRTADRTRARSPV